MLVSYAYTLSVTYIDNDISICACIYSIFKGASIEAVNLLEGLLKLNPESRLTAAEALAHPYVS